MILAFAIFYPISVYFCFKAYREFKGMLYDNGMMNGGGMSSMLPFGGNNANNGGDGGVYRPVGGGGGNSEMRANPSAP